MSFGATEASSVAMFVHQASESRIAMTRRNGISRLRRPRGDFPGGMFAVPVTRNFVISHQWLRELKRRNAGPIAAVYFRIPVRGWVWVGHYGQAHHPMSAIEAVAEFLAAEDQAVWEVRLAAWYARLMRRLGARELAVLVNLATHEIVQNGVVQWRPERQPDHVSAGE